MYKNIGRVVKGLSIALCIIGVTGSIAAGVYLYIGKVLDLWICIVMGIGGAIISWLCSWVLYCIGDTHVRIARLEDKLIPKPKYTEYLAGNSPLFGTCELCGKTTDLVKARIEDKLGTRFRKVCRECYAANRCTPAD